MERLRKQIEFLVEADRLKSVLRVTGLIHDSSRRENSAEHSWTLALMAVMLSEHARETVDILRVVKMCLLHDLVEIYTGDTIVYDQAGRDRQAQLERELAPKFFGRLPQDQAEEMLGLWFEFEEKKTSEARFAAAIDRLAPLIVNHRTGGGSWLKHGITREQVMARNAHIEGGSESLWVYARELIEEATASGQLR
ncbi:MAG: HD domain-containing protein [Bdellovibrionales bacterium]|nr:HD domain-containing protein [Bdellovibrionales bacterium]